MRSTRYAGTFNGFIGKRHNDSTLLVGDLSCQAAHISGNREVAGVRIQKKRSHEEVTEKIHGDGPCRQSARTG